MVDSCPSPLPSGKESKAAAEESMPPPPKKNDVLQEVSAAATGGEDPSRPSTSRRQVLKGVLQQCTIDIIDPDSIQVSLESFPYYLNETTKNTMISSMFVPLKCSNKYPTDLPTVSPRIRLLGPRGSNLYQETLAKALAKFFGAKFLLVDWLMLPKVIDPLKERSLTSLKGTDQPAEEGLEKTAPEGKDDGVKVKVNIKVVSETEPEGDLEGKDDDVNVVSELFEVALKESERGPLVIFLREGAKNMTDESSEAFKIQLERLPKNVVVILSFFPTGILKKTIPQPCTHDHILKRLVSLIEEKRSKDVTSSKDAKTAKTANRTVREPIWKALSTEVTVEIPKDEAQLSEWNQMINRDVETLRSQKNVLCISEALDRNGIQCCDLDELCFKSEVQQTSDEADKIIPWALSHHIMHSSEACGKGSDDQKLSISRKSIEYGIALVIHTLNVTSKKTSSEKSVKDIVPENDFERRLLPEIIPPSEIGVSFEDIGALENVKDTLKELVMLPLQRPELFSRGQLAKPCKGILLFGPPGTGKTMLAKAVATEAGANFINISVSTVTSMWVGQGEKYIKAVFTLASKIAPSVVFVDEIDSMLGKRTYSEQDWMRRMKNEFMVHWDGLRTKQKERVLVLGATNRPFDLDEAVLRRLPRRLMVNLPDVINREKILQVMLSEEELSPNVKLNVIADMTEGFSGSDLKNLCVTAAHCPIRELLEKEKREKALALSENRPLPPLYTGSDVRPLSMKDFEHASRQVGASLSSESQNMAELMEWNEIYGEGGSRNKKSLSYYV